MYVESVQRRATSPIPPPKSMRYRGRLNILNLPAPQYRRGGLKIEIFKIFKVFYDPIVAKDIFCVNGRFTIGLLCRLNCNGSKIALPINCLIISAVNEWNTLLRHKSPDYTNIGKVSNTTWTFCMEMNTTEELIGRDGFVQLF